MGSLLPITSKLLPFRWRNLVYLAEVAALTRMATGVARVLENRPSKQNDPRMSQNEKRQALAERFFVEILGTMGYMGFLHLGQDIVDKASVKIGEATQIPCFSLLPKAEQEQMKTKLTKLGLTIKQLDEQIKAVYNPQNYEKGRQGLIYRVLYEHEGADGKIAPKATLASLQEKLVALADPKAEALKDAKDLKATVRNILDLEHEKVLTKFAASNNKWAATAIITGVGLSAFVGGTLTQWMNDRLIAPTAKHWLNKKFSNGSMKPGATQNQGNPAAATQFQNPAMAQPIAPGVNPFNFPPAMAVKPQQPPIAPVYLPNPKMQPPATAFGAKALPRPYTTPLSSYTSTRLGGSL